MIPVQSKITLILLVIIDAFYYNTFEYVKA